MFRGRMDERYDMSRGVRNNRFRYTCNYMPYRIYNQHVDFLFLATSMQSWKEACTEGNYTKVQNRYWETKPVEELYDTQNDPWEVNNLANDPEYQDILEEMRAETKRWMVDIKDTGVMPEYLIQSVSKEQALYDYLREKNVDVEEWIDIVDKAISSSDEDITNLQICWLLKIQLNDIGQQ